MGGCAELAASGSELSSSMIQRSMVDRRSGRYLWTDVGGDNLTWTWGRRVVNRGADLSTTVAMATTSNARSSHKKSLVFQKLARISPLNIPHLGGPNSQIACGEGLIYQTRLSVFEQHTIRAVFTRINIYDSSCTLGPIYDSSQVHGPTSHGVTHISHRPYTTYGGLIHGRVPGISQNTHNS